MFGEQPREGERDRERARIKFVAFSILMKLLGRKRFVEQLLDM